MSEDDIQIEKYVRRWCHMTPEEQAVRDKEEPDAILTPGEWDINGRYVVIIRPTRLLIGNLRVRKFR